jgi:hypothetical protein
MGSRTSIFSTCYFLPEGRNAQIPSPDLTLLSGGVASGSRFLIRIDSILPSEDLGELKDLPKCNRTTSKPPWWVDTKLPPETDQYKRILNPTLEPVDVAGQRTGGIVIGK